MKRSSLGMWLVFALITAFALGSPASAEVNLLVNPGFEDAGGSYDGWFVFDADDGAQISTAATDNIFRSGAAASKLFGEYTGCPDNPFIEPVGGYGQAFTAIPGKVYEFSGYSYVLSSDPITSSDVCDGNRMLAQIAFFDAPTGGSVIATNEVIIGDFETPTDQWISFSVLSAPAPSGAMRVEALFLFLQPGCDDGSVYVDDVSFCELTPPPADPNLLVNPSFDTNLDGWTTFDNVFFEGRAFGLHTPTGSAKVFGPFTAPEAASGMYQTFPATPGSAWQMDVYSMTTCVEGPVTGANDNVGIAKIIFLDTGGTEIGANEQVIIDNESPLGSWTKHTLIATNAPAGTESVQVFILFVQTTDPQSGGNMFVDDVGFQELSTVDVPLATRLLGFELYQNVPNPFRPSTRIDFALSRADAVDISIYDVMGRRVDTLFQGELGAGPHTLTWDGRAANGTLVAPGVYRYVLKTSTGQTSRSMMLIK